MQLCADCRVDTAIERRPQKADRIVSVVLQDAECFASFALGNRQTNFARADLHMLQGHAGVQEVDRDRLIDASTLGLAGDRGVAELLVEDHAGDKQNAGADGNRQLCADADFELWQRRSDV